MVSEMIMEKKYQSRAFMLMPMTGNIGQIIGPIIGGYLAEPVKAFPWLFGPGSFIGGEHGVRWMINYPYALPNLLSAAFLIGSALCVIFGLEEVDSNVTDIVRNTNMLRHTICSATLLTGAYVLAVS